MVARETSLGIKLGMAVATIPKNIITKFSLTSPNLSLVSQPFWQRRSDCVCGDYHITTICEIGVWRDESFWFHQRSSGCHRIPHFDCSGPKGLRILTLAGWSLMEATVLVFALLLIHNLSHFPLWCLPHTNERGTNTHKVLRWGSTLGKKKWNPSQRLKCEELSRTRVQWVGSVIPACCLKPEKVLDPALYPWQPSQGLLRKLLHMSFV